MTKLAIARATILLLLSVTVPVADPSPDQNVKAFGGKGAGKSDDTAAIQAAINALPEAGGVVSLTADTFLFNGLSLKAQPVAHAVIDFPTGKQ